MKLKELTEAKYYSSDTLKLSGTLVAGYNRQHHEPIELVIGKFGEEEDFGFTKSKPCTLMDFEGGRIAAQYLKAQERIEFGQETGWYVNPVEADDWSIYQFPPGHKNH